MTANNILIGVLPTDVLDVLSAQIKHQTEARSIRLLRLPHPRTGLSSLYLPNQAKEGGTEKGSILEIQVISPTNGRSWFLGEDEVVANGNLMIMTLIDPVFLLIPILQASESADGSPGQFRQLDDVFERATSHLQKNNSEDSDPSTAIVGKDVMFFSSLDCTTSAMRRLCDTKNVTPELQVYRFSKSKLLEYLRAKVSRLATTETIESSRTLLRNLAKDGLMEDGKEDLLQSARLKAGCDLISQYLPSRLYTELLSSYDFTKLDAYLKVLQDEAAASIANTNTSKTNTKTSEKDDGKKRKSKSSQGVDKLKKANTNGMAKLSTFFKKTS